MAGKISSLDAKIPSAPPRRPGRTQSLMATRLCSVFAQRRVNQSVFLAHMAMDNGEIFFFDGAAFQNFSQFAGDCGIFCDDDNAAGFAVETVDQMRVQELS